MVVLVRTELLCIVLFYNEIMVIVKRQRGLFVRNGSKKIFWRFGYFISVYNQCDKLLTKMIEQIHRTCKFVIHVVYGIIFFSNKVQLACFPIF